MVSRSTDKLKNLKEELIVKFKHIPDINQKINFYSLDVCSIEGIKEVCDGIYNSKEQVDVFINCAGGSHVNCILERMEHNDIDIIMDTNAKAPIHWLNELLPKMKNNKKTHDCQKLGHIMLLSSRSSERVLPELTVYAAAKAAIDNFVDGMRLEYSYSNLVFTTVNPGSVDTPFVKNWTKEKQEEHKKSSLNVDNVVFILKTFLNMDIGINKFSFESIQQLKTEPGVMRNG